MRLRLLDHGDRLQAVAGDRILLIAVKGRPPDVFRGWGISTQHGNHVGIARTKDEAKKTLRRKGAAILAVGEGQTVENTELPEPLPPSPQPAN